MKKILFIAIAIMFSFAAMAAKTTVTPVAKAKKAATAPVSNTKKPLIWCLSVTYSDGLNVTVCCNGCSSITIIRES
jgi:hypothetical protein